MATIEGQRTRSALPHDDMHIRVLSRPAPWRAAGGEADEIAVLLEYRLADAAGPAQPGLFAHVPHFAMHRDEDFGANPAIERLQLGAAGVTGDVDRTLPPADQDNAAFGQQVLDA